MADPHAFAGKFLKKLRKIDAEQIEGFIANMIREKDVLEGALNHLTDGVIITDRQHRITWLNETAAHLMGVRANDAIGKMAERVFRPEALRDLQEEYESALEAIRLREVEFYSPRRRALAVSILPIELDGALATHQLWLFSDHTEADRRAEERQQIGTIESLAALTAGVAHEVKNPLNSLNIHTQLMRKAVQGISRQLPEDPSVQRLDHSIGVVLEEIQRLARIVDDFTRAVRPMRPNFRRASINRVLQNIAELVGPECAERQIELVLSVDSEIPSLQIDTEQMQQALLNMVKNSMEAIDKPMGRIVLRSSLKSDHVLLEVEDNGCGIPEHDRLKIFEPYHTTKFDGTGLGLMVVYRIVRAHKGAIGLRSEVGEGTHFSIALPIDERPIRLLASQVDPPLVSGEE